MAIKLTIFFADACGCLCAVVSTCLCLFSRCGTHAEQSSLRPGTCSSATALLQEELRWCMVLLTFDSSKLHKMLGKILMLQRVQ